MTHRQSCQTNQLELRLLGYFPVWQAGRLIPEHAWRSQNTKGLLAYLALNRLARREDLMRTFWPDHGRQEAGANLCSTVRYVRHALRNPHEPESVS
jgi:DNA-binding SARP family transcriptional activator